MIGPDQLAEYRLLCDPAIFGAGHVDNLKDAVAELLAELEVAEAAVEIAVLYHVRGMMEMDGMGGVCLDGAGLLQIGVDRAYGEARENLAAQLEELSHG